MKCDFCNTEIPMGKGILYVQKTGKTFFFCSSKCKKNTITLKRDPKMLKWTGAYVKGKKKKAKKKKSKRKGSKK